MVTENLLWLAEIGAVTYTALYPYLYPLARKVNVDEQS